MVTIKLSKKNLNGFLKYVYGLEQIAEANGFDNNWNCDVSDVFDALRQAHATRGRES